MRYYFLKYTEDICADFDGLSFGPFIKIRNIYKGDAGILEHEKTHVRQWAAMTVASLIPILVLSVLCSSAFLIFSGVAFASHGLLYRFFRRYRKWAEVRAYRSQLDAGSYSNKDFAATNLSEKYNLRLSFDEARELLA